MLRRSRQPEMGPAAERLRDSLSALVKAVTRWLALQPVGQGWEERGQRLRERCGGAAGDMSAWASGTAQEVGDAATRARKRTRRLLVDAVLLVLMGYLLDWALSKDPRDDAA